MNKLTVVFVLSVLIILFSCKLDYCENEFANHINVPNDYTTIQSAIDASVNGDTILVDPGTYYENINFYGKEITLASHFIIDEDEECISNTIIDGSNNASVVTFENGETNNTTLIGFTIQNGKATNWSANSGQGGGIYCSKANPSFQNLIIQNNYGNRGGGIAFNESNALIDNCRIFKNESDQEGGGAGIYIRENSSIEIYNTRIDHNTCVNNDPQGELWGSLQGAGIKAWNSNIFLSNVSIHDNHINNKSGIGGGIALVECNVKFDLDNRCSIYNNTIAYGINGNDLFATWFNGVNNVIDVYLDTFTVMNPTDYYAYPIEDFTFDILKSIE